MKDRHEIIKELKLTTDAIYKLLQNFKPEEDQLNLLQKYVYKLNEHTSILKYLSRETLQKKSNNYVEPVQEVMDKTPAAKLIVNRSFHVDLNQKIMFLKELFDHNEKSYKETVNMIENADDIEQVKTFIKGFNWDEDHFAFKEFMLLLKKYFAKDSDL